MTLHWDDVVVSPWLEDSDEAWPRQYQEDDDRLIQPLSMTANALQRQWTDLEPWAVIPLVDRESYVSTPPPPPSVSSPLLQVKDPSPIFQDTHSLVTHLHVESPMGCCHLL